MVCYLIFIRRQAHDPTSLLVVNNREKTVLLKGLHRGDIQRKVQLLLDSSGAKIVPLKRKMIVSTTESARGIWSGLHAEPYRI